MRETLVHNEKAKENNFNVMRQPQRDRDWWWEKYHGVKYGRYASRFHFVVDVRVVDITSEIQ